jgi:formate hydrogenlyase subunit 6/NADH:ubiquinone oxidoreductase subunit I
MEIVHMPANPSLRNLLKEHLVLAVRLRYLEIVYHSLSCVDCGACFQVCPMGCWDMDPASNKAVYLENGCIACGACVRQCPADCISLTIPRRNPPGEYRPEIQP